jgi:hypothetical protein
VPHSPSFLLLAALALLLVVALALPAQPVSTAPARGGPDVANPPLIKAVDLNELRPGMSATEVRQKLGAPRRTARQILSGRYLEQWTYDAPLAVRIEFDWRKGQERQILTVHPLTPVSR